jgi:hypothetical protein
MKMQRKVWPLQVDSALYQMDVPALSDMYMRPTANPALYQMEKNN